MADFSDKRLPEGKLIAAVAVVSLAAVLLVWFAARAHRPVEEAEQADKETAAEAESASVQLDRPELVKAAGIQVEPVETRTVENMLTCNGSAGFNQNQYVKVPPKADGILAKINVDVGARVRAGDVLATVNSQPLGDLKASYIKALVHQEHLRWQIERYQAAAEGVAAKNLIEARHLLEEELADTARIKNRLENFGLSGQQIDVIPKQRDLSTLLPVLAPRDGVVVLRQAVEGEPVQTAVPLFAIADLETMWVHLYVYESQLRSVRIGQLVTFYPDGLGGQGFDGTIDWSSPEVDAATRTIQLRAQVANREGALRANMFGKAVLHVENAQPRLVVPQAAVQSHLGKHVVFVQQPNNAFEMRPISLGIKDGPFWEVTAGLAAGEKVATIGSFLLKANLENPDFGKVE